MLPTAWVVLPAAALVFATATGGLTPYETANLVIWLAVPWVLVFASLVVARSLARVGRGRWL